MLIYKAMLGLKLDIYSYKDAPRAGRPLKLSQQQEREVRRESISSNKSLIHDIFYARKFVSCYLSLTHATSFLVTCLLHLAFSVHALHFSSHVSYT